jgi:C-terminal processing protease CtpA/Prc
MENEKKTAEQFSYRFTAADTGMAYIKIKGFSYDDYSSLGYKKMHAELFSRIDSLNPKGIIIDLRGNSGGNLNLAENLMSYLVDKPF